MRWDTILDAPFNPDDQVAEKKFFGVFYAVMLFFVLTVVNYFVFNYYIKWNIYLCGLGFILYISLRTFFANEQNFLLYSRWLGMSLTVIAVALIYTKDYAYEYVMYASILAYIPSFIYYFFLAKEE